MMYLPLPPNEIAQCLYNAMGSDWLTYKLTIFSGIVHLIGIYKLKSHPFIYLPVHIFPCCVNHSVGKQIPSCGLRPRGLQMPTPSHLL